MEIIKILSVVAVLLTNALKTFNYYVDEPELYVYPDSYNFGQLSTSISPGHIMFLEHFDLRFRTSTTKNRTYSLHCSCTSWLNTVLLLCGDVHPCPGPATPSPASPSPAQPRSQYSVFMKRGLHFVHINARSLLPKMDELRLLALETRAACIALSETWLDDTIFDSEVSINNYNIIRKDRNRHGGGVCLYIRCDIAFNTRADLDHDNIEALWTELLLPKTKPILFSVIYRPPMQTDFYNILEDICTSTSHFSEYETYILGDFNTDVSKSNSYHTELKNFMKMFDFKQLITDPTRISLTSCTVIDLILASDIGKIAQSGTIDTCFSDHSLIYCTRKVYKDFYGKHNTVRIRSLKNYNKDDFQYSLLDTDWISVLLSDTVSEAWICFKTLFLSVLDNIAPVREIRTKQRSEPWIDSEILQSIRDRNKAFKEFRKNKSEANFEKFKTLRNNVQYSIQKSKENYFSSTCDEHKHDAKSLWKSLKALGMPSKKSDRSSAIGLSIDNELCFDKLKVAKKFNEFYTTVASTLVSKLPRASFKFGKKFVESFYSKKGISKNSHSFSLVSENKVLGYLNGLGTKKATGLDGIPARFVVDSAVIIAKPLTHVINLSLIQGVVPGDLKSARVVPLYKKNDKTKVENYRPVSILGIISKIFERVVYDQVESYLKQHNLLYNFQSGFRTGFSTDTCLVHLSDFVRFQMDKGNLVGMVLLDLQKAFDTVDHSILKMKLEALGLGDDIIRWFISYLSDRQQLVDISGVHSSFSTVTCGVPQGSILGPLLFLIYVNDMSSVVKHELLLYADDSAILVSGKDRQSIEHELTNDLESVSSWLIDNKLSLHLGKTESILFGSKQKLKSNTTLHVSCNGIEIQSSSTVKYLGVNLDNTLSCEDIAYSVIQKANTRLKFLYRKRAFLTEHTKKLLVTSLIQCHFDYACSFWFNCLTNKLKYKLQVTQNKIIRFVLSLDHRSHVGSEHFKLLKWLPVRKRVEHISLCHIFKIKNGLAPSYMGEHFVLQDSIHCHNTRFSKNGCFALPRVNSHGAKSFSFIGCKVWNDLPANIKNITRFNTFRVQVKDHLLRNSS